MSGPVYRIIYPRGDKTKIKVIEYYLESDDLDHYALASRETFYDTESANIYGKELALKHNKEFIPFGPFNDYLD